MNAETENYRWLIRLLFWWMFGSEVASVLKLFLFSMFKWVPVAQSAGSVAMEAFFALAVIGLTIFAIAKGGMK